MQVAGQYVAAPVVDDPSRGCVPLQTDAVDVGRLLIVVAAEHLQAPELADQRQESNGYDHPVHDRSDSDV